MKDVLRVRSDRVGAILILILNLRWMSIIYPRTQLPAKRYELEYFHLHTRSLQA